MERNVRDYQSLKEEELLVILLGDKTESICCESQTMYGRTLLEGAIAAMSPKRKEIALAVLELRNRCLSNESNKITCAGDIYEKFRFLEDRDKEEIWLLCMNQSMHIVKKIKLASGGITSCAFDVRIALKEALLSNAAAIVLVHNHPSGNTRPSREDDKITKVLNDSAKLMSINLMDHVIIGNGYYSYQEEGKL